MLAASSRIDLFLSPLLCTPVCGYRRPHAMARAYKNLNRTTTFQFPPPILDHSQRNQPNGLHHLYYLDGFKYYRAHQDKENVALIIYPGPP